MKGNNAECVSAPTNTILPTTASTYHSLHSSRLVIYVQQTILYQNIAKLLTQRSIWEEQVSKAYVFVVLRKRHTWLLSVLGFV